MLVANLFGNVHLKDQERDGWIIWRWIFGRRVVRMGGGWIWLRIVSNSEFWGKKCWIFEVCYHSVSTKLNLNVLELTQNMDAVRCYLCVASESFDALLLSHRLLWDSRLSGYRPKSEVCSQDEWWIAFSAYTQALRWFLPYQVNG
jgi:hypothetical protein